MEPPERPDDFTDDDTGHDRAFAVRPYAITGGRTRASTAHLPLEALVQSLAAGAPLATTLERRRILELTRDQYLSLAELSAHIEMPVGVIRVLVGDLADEGLVRVHGLSATSSPATSLSVLESVLNGISSL